MKFVFVLFMIYTPALFAIGVSRPACDAKTEGLQTTFQDIAKAGPPVVAFCNGSTWTDLSGTNVSGSFCTTKEDGQIKYESGAIRFCNSGGWYEVKGNIIGGCSSKQAGSLTYDSSGKFHKYCDGTNWNSLVSTIPMCQISSAICNSATGLMVFSYTTTVGCKQQPVTTCAVNCVGSWSSCVGSSQKYTWTTAPKNGGSSCPVANGATQSCTVTKWNVFKFYIGADIRSCPYAMSSNGITSGQVSTKFFTGLGSTCSEPGKYYMSPGTVVQGGTATSMKCDGTWKATKSCPSCRVYICK